MAEMKTLTINDEQFTLPFAPAGYGLGGAQLITADIDNITTPGWYYWNTTTTIAGITANYWFMHVSAYGSGGAHCVQRLYPCINTSGFIELIRRRFASDWEPIEFVNPPMLPGVEYRTTERWNGKVVWTVLVDCGTIVAGENTISTNFTCTSVIGSRGNSGSFVLPQLYESARNDKYLRTLNVSVASGKIYIAINAGSLVSSTSPNYVQVWYTKD